MQDEGSGGGERDARRRALNRMAKARLVAMCRTGIVRPDGGRSYIEGGMYALRQWQKDEVIGAVLDVEHPPDGGTSGVCPENRGDL